MGVLEEAQKNTCVVGLFSSDFFFKVAAGNAHLNSEVGSIRTYDLLVLTG